MVDLHHTVHGCCPDIELTLCQVRNDVRRVAALRYNPMNPYIPRQLLSQQSDRIKYQHQRIQCIDTVLRIGRSVGGLPPELNPDRCTGDFGMSQLMMIRSRMYAKRCVHILKISFPDKTALGTSVLAAFLARRTIHPDLPADVVNHLLQGSCRQ